MDGLRGAAVALTSVVPGWFPGVPVPGFASGPVLGPQQGRCTSPVLILTSGSYLGCCC